MSKSRTILSLKNSIVALLFYFVNLILQFYSRQVFFVHLGTEVLGLNTTATSLLQFLNLAELGVGSAIGVTLYKPLLNKDYTSVNEIVSLQGWLYKRIGGVIILGSIVMMLFFPIIFSKSELPLWYAYASYGVLLFSSLLGYFFNYKQIVLSASQQEYYIRFSYNASMIAKVVCQIIALQMFDNPYIWWLCLEFVFAIIASYALSKVVKRKCVYLSTSDKLGSSVRKKYPDILLKVKQMFFHKASRYALTQTSPLIIYAYASLSLVAIYGNYLLVVTGITSLLTAIFDGTNAGVGNLVAEGDKEKILKVFRELFSSRFLIVSIASFCFYYVADPFVSIWIGPDYILDVNSKICLTVIFYLNTSRTVVDAFINAYGLFRDIAAPIIEAAINLGLSILLGYFFGLPGILAGVAISLLLVVFCWKPYFLFRSGFQSRVLTYIRMYAKHIAIYSVAWLFGSYIIELIPIEPSSSIINLILYSIICILALLLIEFPVLFFIEQGMKDFTARIVRIVKR